MRQNIRAVLFDADDTLFDRSKAQRQTLELIVQLFPEIFSAFELERVAKAYKESDRISAIEFEAGAPSDGLPEKRSRLFLQLLEPISEAIHSKPHQNGGLLIPWHFSLYDILVLNNTVNYHII